MTINDLIKYIFIANVGMIIVFISVFSVAAPRIKDRSERNYFATLLFVLIGVCALTIMSYYKIVVEKYFTLIRGIIQPVLVFITTYYLYKKHLKKKKQ